MKFLPLLLISSLLCSCASKSTRISPKTKYSNPQIINVSSWDPKEKQRGGIGFSEHNVTALRANGAKALIARTAKGDFIDPKAPQFLKSADRAGLLLGAYHYYLPQFSPEAQAREFVQRVRHIAQSQNLRQNRILLVGDFDSKCRASQVLRFCQTVERLSGTRPVVYLENSAGFKAELSNAQPAVKNALRRYPLWIALYSTKDPANPGRRLTPQALTNQYGVWRTYAMWQYGGVLWENRRSQPKVYAASSFRAPQFFGNIDRPCERSVYKGNEAEFRAFWDRHSMSL